MRLGFVTPRGWISEAELRSLQFPEDMPSLAFCDLQGADLTRLDLRAVDLTGADLRYADLRDADLRGACLLRAQLFGAQWSGALVTDVAWPEGFAVPLHRRIPGYHGVDRQAV